MADKEETFYAVYQYGYAIHGVGKTKEETIENAKEWVDNQDTLEEDLKDRPNDGDLTMITISEAVKVEVDEYGGDVAIQEDEDGIYRLPRESDVGGLPEDVQRLMDALDKSGMDGFKQLEKDGKVVEVRNKEEFEHFIRSVMPKIDEAVERERANPKDAENTVYETLNLRINRK